MKDNIIQRIQNWYKLNCNGDWEHSWGLKIGTLDNPGWEVKIDLEDTALENANFQKEFNNTEDDWYVIKTENKKFVAFGDPDKLEIILQIFLEEFLPSQISKEFSYEIYAQLKNLPIYIWRPVKAIMLNENLFEIIEIPKNVEKEIKVEKLNDFEKINSEINYEDIEYNIGDKVVCDLKRVFDDLIPVIKNKLTN